jgi:hypothetical protein
MQRREFLGGLLGAAAWPLAAQAEQSMLPLTGLTSPDIETIAQEAYTYFYPLVLMDITRKYFTNVEPGKLFGRGPMNTFSHTRTFPPATIRGATHTNFDTLYSSAWLDLTKEPVVIGRIRSLELENVPPARALAVLSLLDPTGGESYRKGCSE